MKKKLIWIYKSPSFKASEAFENNYYAKMSPEDKISAMQQLREQVSKIKKGIKYERRKGLRRSIKIIQQT